MSSGHALRVDVRRRVAVDWCQLHGAVFCGVNGGSRGGEIGKGIVNGAGFWKIYTVSESVSLFDLWLWSGPLLIALRDRMDTISSGPAG